MVTQELIDYIKKSLAQGMSTDAIKASLLQNGWNSSDVDETFAQINTPAMQPANPIPSVNPMPAANPIPATNNYPVQEIAKKGHYGIFGLIAIIVCSLVNMYILNVLPITEYTALLYTIAVFVISAAILYLITKLFRIPAATFGRALFMGGYVGIIGVASVFLAKGIDNNSIALPIIVVSIVGWLLLFVKIYKTKWSKAFAVGLVTMIINIIIGAILVFVVGLSFLSNFMSTVAENSNQQSVDSTNMTENTNNLTSQTDTSEFSNIDDTPWNEVVSGSLRVYYPAAYKAYDADYAFENGVFGQPIASKGSAKSTYILFSDNNYRIIVSDETGTCYKLNAKSASDRITSASGGSQAEIGTTGGLPNSDRCTIINNQMIILMDPKSTGAPVPAAVVSVFEQIVTSITIAR